MVAMVTGGGQGLGRSMVLGLLGAGHEVASVDRNPDALAETMQLAEAKGTGAKLHNFTADLSHPDAPAKIFAEVSRLSTIDVLVNNAGLGQNSIRQNDAKNLIRFWELSSAQWQAFFQVNTQALIMLSSLASGPMRAQGRGRIINITTSFDTMIRGGMAAYGATKAANEAFTSIIAADLAGTGVTANVLIPGGMTNTPMSTGRNIDPASMIQPDVMVPPLLWLVSDAAASVTGKRVNASKWNPALPPEQAMEIAGAPAAWPQLGKGTRPAGAPGGSS